MNKWFRFYLALVLVAAAAVLVTASWAIPRESGPFWNGIAAFAVLCFVSEASYLKLRVGRTETQSSVAFIPYIASFLLFESGWAAVVTASSMLAAETVVRKKPWPKVVFNTAQIALCIGSASLVFALLGGHAAVSLEAMQMPPVAVISAAGTYLLLNSTAVSVGVTVITGERFRRAWMRIAGGSLVYDVFSSPLGPLLAYLYARFEVPGILLLIVPLYAIRHIYQVNLQLEQVNRDLLELMVKAIEARDPYTSGHSERVSDLAARIAEELGLSSKAVEQIRTAALLHDVGKIYEEFAMLLRMEGKLDPTQKALMQTHSVRSADLVSTISGFRGAITEAVRHHHENYDGTGYPRGLAGRAIPVGSRIIMIADTIDAMTTDRPYRKALSLERVAGELQRYAGKQFDPGLVDIVLRSPRIREMLLERSGTEAEEKPGQVSAPFWATNVFRASGKTARGAHQAT